MHSNLQKLTSASLGVKEFVCQYCNKAFREQRTLKIHERIHGEKRYHYQFCFQSFVSVPKGITSMRHIREHNGKVMPASNTPKICKTAAALGMHQKKHLFKSPSQQEKVEGDLTRKTPIPLENPHFVIRKALTKG